MDRLSFTSPAPIGPADLALPPTEPIDIAADTAATHSDVLPGSSEMAPSFERVAP